MAVFSLPSWLLSIPPMSRYLTGFLIFSSTILALSKAYVGQTDLNSVFRGGYDSSLAFPWLVMVPGSVLWYPWTLLTSSFVEVNLIEFVSSVILLPLCSRYFERIWGPSELLKFVIAVVLGSNIIAVFINLVEGIVIGAREEFLLGMSYHGLEALQAGFLVAFTQVIPEHQVMFFGGLVKLRVKQLPMLYVTFSNVMVILGYQSPFILIQFGWLVSWWYLRFFKKNEGIEFRGDRSETFAFKNWFPPILQKPVGILGNTVFTLMVRLRLLQPWTPSDLEAGVFGGNGVPGGARAEAERRRAMALKALDQRLQTKSPRPAAPPPPGPSGLTSTSTPANPASGTTASNSGGSTSPTEGTSSKVEEENGDGAQ